MKIQSQHSKCLKFLPAGSSRAHTLTLTWRPLYQPLPSLRNPMTQVCDRKDLRNTFVSEGLYLLGYQCLTTGPAMNLFSYFSYELIPPFPHLVHTSLLAFLPDTPFVHGTHAMNSPGIAFLCCPPSSSSGLNPNHVFSTFLHIVKPNMLVLSSWQLLRGVRAAVQVHEDTK